MVMAMVALGDLRFLLASEQGKAPNLAQIATQRIERNKRAALACVGGLLAGLVGGPRNLVLRIGSFGLVVIDGVKLFDLDHRSFLVAD